MCNGQNNRAQVIQLKITLNSGGKGEVDQLGGGCPTDGLTLSHAVAIMVFKGTMVTCSRRQRCDRFSTVFRITEE